MDAPILEVQDLKKHFPIRRGMFGRQVGAIKAVDGISFQSTRGDLRTGRKRLRQVNHRKAPRRLISPSGHQVCGRISYRLGRRASLLRRNPADLPGPIPPQSADDHWRDSREPLVIGLAHGKKGPEVQQLLEVVGLSPYHAKRYPEFSGGQRRGGHPRALALNPS